MVRTVFLLAITLTCCCSDVVAFVAPLASRMAVATRATTVRAARPGAPAAGSASLNMRYVAMNKFKVKLGCEDEFEEMWRERESSLADFSGFEQFMLLKVDNGDEAAGGDDEFFGDLSAAHTEFISHTVWTHQNDYDDWKKSQAFKKSHKGGGGGGGKGPGVVAGGMSKMGDLIVERPVPGLYDAVIIEPIPPEHQGGLWDFEDEPSYFDGDM